MGTVLHRHHNNKGERQIQRFQSPSRWGRCCIIYSQQGRYIDNMVFQSPSRWGRCCIDGADLHARGDRVVSVPFSMGTVLHPSGDRAAARGTPVSVPFSMGTVLHQGTRIDDKHDQRVSVPFSMGTVLHPDTWTGSGGTCTSFSPLLDGDGVASSGWPMERDF